MKKHLLSKIALFFFLLLQLSQTLQAQMDVFNLPTAAEKKEIKSLVESYRQWMNTVGDTLPLPKRKAASGRFMMDKVISPNIFVYNDIDSASKPQNFISFLKYSQALTDTVKGNLKVLLDTSKLSFDKIKFDKIRKYYFTEVKGIKTFRWVSIVPKPVSDTSIVHDSLAYDTLVTQYSQKLNFMVRFDKVGTVFKNYRINGISKTGTPVKLEPLPPLISWYLTLDADWKSILGKKVKLEEYPSEFDLEKATNQIELDLSGSLITNLEPLKKFINLENLNCTNTKIQSLEPILGLSRLKVLNITRTKIDTLAGIEKLVSLEEFRCVGNKLEGIAEVASLKNLVEFDCSENDLTDISPVKELLTLKELSFSLNIRIKSIDAISELVNLEWLAIGKIDIRNLDPLKKLINLVHLDLFNTNITSLEPIRHLEKVIYLNLDHDKMSTLDAIKNYRFLTDLHLSSSSIRDLSEIRNFNYLRVLDISNTLIADLGPVHKFEDMKVLKAQYTKIGKDEIQRFKKNHPNCQLTYY